MTAAILPCALTTSLSSTIAVASENNMAAFELSSHLDEVFLKRHKKMEVDESLFDKFLKYSLLVTDKDSLSEEELKLCHKIFETERTYMPYITCSYARETIKNATIPPRISTDNEKMLAYMADGTARNSAECYSYYPDIKYDPFNYNHDVITEYWCDVNGTERLICNYAINFGPAYEKSYNEEPDWTELDRLVELCWAGGELIEHDGTYLYSGIIDGYRFKDLLDTQTITSGIWVYQLLDDDSAFIVDCTLPKYSDAEPIEEALVLPTEIDGYVVSGIQDALSGTGVSKLIIPDNYKNVRFFSDMDYLEKIEVNAPELELKYFLSDCPNLKSAVLNVRSVENNAFYGCNNLKSLEIKGAEGISYNAFSDLPSLTDVILPENLRYIGQDAFANTALTELVIPKNVEIVGVVKNPYIYNNELIDPLTADRIRIADEDCVLKLYYNSEAHLFAIANDCKFSLLDVMQYGDVNADGAFNIADIAVFQKWLLGDSFYGDDIKLNNWKAADLCNDDRLDVFDLCLMKQELLKNGQPAKLPTLVEISEMSSEEASELFRKYTFQDIECIWGKFDFYFSGLYGGGWIFEDKSIDLSFDYYTKKLVSASIQPIFTEDDYLRSFIEDKINTPEQTVERFISTIYSTEQYNLKNRVTSITVYGVDGEIMTSGELRAGVAKTVVVCYDKDKRLEYEVVY